MIAKDSEWLTNLGEVENLSYHITIKPKKATMPKMIDIIYI